MLMASGPVSPFVDARCRNVTRSISSASCSACADNRFRNDNCLVDGHPCLMAIKPSGVIDWLKYQLN